MAVVYKEFKLNPAPYQLAESGEWELRVTITKHHDNRNETLQRTYSAKNTFKSKIEAEAHAIEFGKQIIDGEFHKHSIKDLL